MPDPIPRGFEPLETESPFILNVGPLYCLKHENESVFGLLVEEKHCNRSKRLHGSMISAVSDIALGNNIGLALANDGHFDGIKAREAPGAPIATVSMTTDFVGTASVGDWVEVHVDVQRTGKSLAFANAYHICNGERIARSSGIFKVLRR